MTSRAPIKITDKVIRFIRQYGGRCRDCADESGVCPSSGLPCAHAEKAIRHVLSAYNYGVKNGYLPRNGETASKCKLCGSSGQEGRPVTCNREGCPQAKFRYAQPD